MRDSEKWRSVFFLAIFLLLTVSAHADSLSSLMGWPYNIHNTPGLYYSSLTPNSTDPIPRRIAYLIYPVLGFPAFVEPGDGLRVFVKFDNPEIFLDPAQWQIRLTTQFQNPSDNYATVGQPVAQNYDLTVTEVIFDAPTLTYQLTCAIPDGIPEDLYALMVVTTSFTDVQPGCVKVKKNLGSSMTFIHFTDSQPHDISSNSPSNQLNNFDYPGYGQLRNSEAILHNEIDREFALLNPDFALFTGDLIYGVDEPGDLASAYRIIEETHVPLFMVPGNHDGYAWWDFANQVKQDGLEYYSRNIGPQYYSFDIGDFRFVMLNSYDGTPLRRESGKLVVASPVDNWGGFLSEEQLAWVGRELDEAQSAGQTPLVFLHHDPRGPYTADAPYPTDPFYGDGTEYWNYDSSTWDSNPFDDISNETPEHNTGTLLIGLLIQHHVPYIFLGHHHYDGTWTFKAGDPITDRFDTPVSDLVAEAPLTFVQTTTCSAGVNGKGDYEGYRVIESLGRDLTRINYLENPIERQSIPAGNFWSEPANNDGTFTEAQITVVNGLPTALPVNLQFYMAGIPSGYEIVNENKHLILPIDDVGLGQNGEVVLYVKGSVGAAATTNMAIPVPKDNEVRTEFTARAKLNNKPPVASFEVAQSDTDDRTWDFDASASHDPEGSDLRYFWDFGDGYTAVGQTASHTYLVDGAATVTLTVLDANGGESSSQTLVNLPTCCPDREHHNGNNGCGGCGVGAGQGSWPNALPMLAVLMAMLGLRFARRTRRHG